MTLRAALRALRRNKMRSVLTMLGIIIGVAAVITMVSVGQGANAAVQKQIESLGTNLLMVIPGATTAGGAALRLGRRVDAHAARRGSRSSANARRSATSPTSAARSCRSIYGNQELVHGRSGHHAVVLRECEIGTCPRAASSPQRDDDAANRVVVLGQTVVDQLFGPGEDPDRRA